MTALPAVGLSLNAPETNRGRITSDAPAPFVPAPAVREISAPQTSSKHPTGWNKMKIDPEVRPASHPGEVDAFDDPFQDRLAQVGNRPPQSRFPRTTNAFQPPPDLNEPPVQPFLPAAPELAPELQQPGLQQPGLQQPGLQQPLQPAPELDTPPERMEEPPPESPLRPRFQIPTDPDAERATDNPPTRNPPPRNPQADPFAPNPNPNNPPMLPENPEPGIPPAAEAGEKPKTGPEVEDAKKPSKDCKKVYNQRDCCQTDDQCNQARRDIRASSIRNISLDITPRFKPDSLTWADDYAARDKQLAKAEWREWTDREGGALARGRLIDIAQGRAVIREDNGQIRRLSFNALSEDDVCFLNAWWGLPTECVAGGEFQERCWTPATFAWTASGLCHKPLYFEEVQLERYGHTAGPIFQPFVSGIHFFGNAVLLPYKMGINPPNECQYALGYYRPGNCAPWVLPPFPLSVRGAAAQVGVVVGGVFLIP